jgi:hypothetical protein
MTNRQSGNAAMQCHVVLVPSGYTVKETGGGLLPTIPVTGIVNEKFGISGKDWPQNKWSSFLCKT